MARVIPKLAGCAALVAVLTTGCGRSTPVQPEAPSPTATISATVPTTSLPPTTTTTGTTTVTTPPTTSSTQAASKECKVADLTLSIRGEEGALGTIYRGLVFTNTGRRTCTMQGFPGVSFVTGPEGRQVGQAAWWDGPKGGVITLKPGDAATAPVGFANVDAYNPADCRPTPVRGLRVYPPHDTAAAFVPFPARACAATSVMHLRVLTVHAGPDLN